MSVKLVLRFGFIFVLTGCAGESGQNDDALKAPHTKPVFRVDARRPEGHSSNLRRVQPLYWHDLSVNALVGSLLGGFQTFSTPYWEEGKGNRPDSLIFNGVDQYVDFGDGASTKMSRAFSIEVWFKIAGTGGSPEYGILVNREGEYELGVSPQGEQRKVWFAVANQVPGWREVRTNLIVEENRWHQVVLTYDADKTSENYVLYHNGVKVFTALGSGSVGDYHTDMNSLFLGGRQYLRLNQFFHGQMSIVRLFSSAIGSAEVQARCNRLKKHFDVTCK